MACVAGHTFKSDLEKNIFLWTLKFWEYRFGGKNMYITTNSKLRQNSVNQIFYPNAFFFFLLTGAIWYYHAIYIVFTYFASYAGYEDDIFEVISNLHVQESKFGGKIYKFGGNLKKSWAPQSSWSSFFSRSA